MRVIWIEAPGRISITERPAPHPAEGEVRIRMRAGGICGTDLHVYEGLLPAAPSALPMVPGHDVVGVIEALGPAVDPSRLGQRVTVDPAACCARAARPGPLCPACARSATHLCAEASYMGLSAPGGFAERLVLPAARAVALPDSVDDRTATVLEPVAVGLHLLEQIADRPGSALVLGGGPIGAVAAVLLQDAGRRVTLVEPRPYRRDRARQLGAREVVAPPAIPEADFSVIVEASGHPSAAETIAARARPGATIVLVGGATEIPGRLVLTRELEVRAAKGGRGLYPEAVALVAAGGLEPGRLVSHGFPAREAARAFALAARERDTVSRVMLDLTAW